MPALLLPFITGLLIKMSRKYSPSWKPLRTGNWEHTWEEEEVGGKRECRAAVPEKPWAIGRKSPVVNFLVAKSTGLGISLSETSYGF